MGVALVAAAWRARRSAASAALARAPAASAFQPGGRQNTWTWWTLPSPGIDFFGFSYQMNSPPSAASTLRAIALVIDASLQASGDPAHQSTMCRVPSGSAYGNGCSARTAVPAAARSATRLPSAPRVARAPKNVWCTQSVCVLHIRPRLAMSISFCARVAGSGRICVALGVQPTRSWRDCKALTSEETQLRSCLLPSTREVRMPGSIFCCGRIGREIE